MIHKYYLIAGAILIGSLNMQAHGEDPIAAAQKDTQQTEDVAQSYDMNAVINNALKVCFFGQYAGYKILARCVEFMSQPSDSYGITNAIKFLALPWVAAFTVGGIGLLLCPPLPILLYMIATNKFPPVAPA